MGLINLNNEDNECFCRCHARYLNPHVIHPERIKKSDREMLLHVDYKGIEFPVSVKEYCKIYYY